MAWSFEPIVDPNVRYEIHMHDGEKNLRVTRVQILRIEPVVFTETPSIGEGYITVEDVITRVRNVLASQ